MKGSTALVIGGVIIVAGISAYVLYRHLQSQTKEPTKKFPDKTVEDEVQAKVIDLAEVKEEAATSIRDRHSEAANFLNESMQTVFSDKKIIDENDIKLDRINNDLNDLLK